MSLLRFLRLGMRAAEWATPHVKEWYEERHKHRLEGARHLKSHDFREAEPHLLAAYQEKHSKPHQLDIVSQLAVVEMHLKKFDQAAAHAAEAAQLARALANREAQWEAVETLVEIYCAQGRLDQAASTLQAMEVSEQKRLQPNREKIVRTSRARAKLLHKLGRSAEAVEAMEASAKAAEKLWGSEDVETAHALCELGSLHAKLRDNARALPHLERAIGIYRITAGFDSAEAAVGLQNLAAALEEAGHMDRAIAEYERFVVAQERVVGSNREEIAQVQVRLAALYIQAGRSSAAREMLTLAIGVLGPKPSRAYKDAMEIMAVAEDLSGRPVEAQRWKQKAAAMVLPKAESLMAR